MHLDKALQRLRIFAAQNTLFTPSDKLLVAVSGGMDSMCMLRLVMQLPNEIAVAHVNYMLRGEDSDSDAAFVRQFCGAHGINYFEHQLDLKAHIDTAEDSVQQSAREVRYGWFLSLCKQEGYHAILTGHHADDSLESVFINLMRGTGIRGMTGIPPKRHANEASISRPMLCFNRAEIEHLVQELQLPYREDASNKTDDYLRNRIRHHLIPLLEEIRPGAPNRILKNMSRMREENAWLDKSISEKLQALVSFREKQKHINLKAVRDMKGGTTVLYAAVKMHGFTWEQCADLVSANHQPGTRYLSATHELVVDREDVILVPLENLTAKAFAVNVNCQVRTPAGTLSITRCDIPEDLDTSSNIEYIDPDKSGTSFLLRSWVEGDTFHPLGMEGRQKLQDFFTNLKLSLTDKRRVRILTAGGNIVWIVGFRLDDRFKIDSASRSALRLEWSNAF